MIKSYKNKDSFGTFIRKFRIKKNIGQRELANKISIAPSYLNDIEKNKRTAPKKELIKKISDVLEINLEILYDLAGSSKNRIAPDIEEFILNNPTISSLLRTIKENKISNKLQEDIVRFLSFRNK